MVEYLFCNQVVTGSIPVDGSKLVIKDKYMNTKMAVLPFGDILPHNEFSEECWCIPRVEEDGRLIIHEAFDGRE